MIAPRTTVATTLALALAPLLLVLPGAGCSSSSSGPSGPDPAHADVVFQGTATDAALTAMLAVKPVDDPPHATYFDNPKDLAEIPATPVITFTWHDGQKAAMDLAPRPAAPALFGLDARPRAASLSGTLARLLGERTAHAGTPAMSGRGYLLAFSVLDTGAPLFRVFTSSTSYTPDQAAWAKVATGKWTSLHVTSATFAGDQLAGGAPPVNGQSIAFCIGMWK